MPEEDGGLLQEMDWQLYFSTLSDGCLGEIADHLHRERMKRDYRRYEETLPPLSAEEVALVGQNKYIDAIRDYRSRNRVGLREAKFAIDRHRGVV